MTRTPPRRALIAMVGVAVAVVAAACQPPPPSGPAPVRRVLLLGDSLSWGLFLATPSVQPDLARTLGRRGIRLTMIGGPGATPLEPWPGQEPWDQQLDRAVAAGAPDVVVIQSMLFPGGAEPARQAAYREAMRRLYDIAQSRGARVLRATHPVAVDPTVAQETFIAQSLQAEAAEGRGVGVIAVNTALDRCPAPFMPDGFHLSASGERCHANAIVSAVDAMRRRR